MKFYTIQNDEILIADSVTALTKFYLPKDIFELPADYEKGKYIIGEKEISVEVPDYDENGNIIGYHTEVEVIKVLVLNPEWSQIQFKKLKKQKTEENETEVYQVLPKVFKIKVGQEQTECHFIYNKDTQDDLNSAAIGFLSGEIEQKQWTDEQGITVQLSAEDVQTIFMTFRSVVDAIWEKWGSYKQAINSAKTLAELQEISIDYSEFKIKEGENS